MQVNPLFLLEFLLFNGGALVWAGWEYWQIRPSKSDRDAARDTPPPPSPEDPGHPEGQHRPDDR